MSQVHSTSANTAPGCAGRALLLLSLVGLLGGCEATYDNTKGWANRLEASILEAAHELEGDPESAVGDNYTPEDVGAPRPPQDPANLRGNSSAEGEPDSALPTPQPAPANAGKQREKAEMSKQAAPAEDGATKRAIPPLPKPKPQLAGAAKESAPIKAAKTSDAVAMVLHLSSLRSEAAAEREWRTLKRDFPMALGALEPEIRRTQLGDKGTFYRVLAGPLPSHTEAQQACDAIKARNVKQYCRVIPSAPAENAPS